MQVEQEIDFDVEAVELKPAGGDITVTNDNRAEYVELYAHHLLQASIAPQFSAFRRGFDKVVFF